MRSTINASGTFSLLSRYRDKKFYFCQLTGLSSMIRFQNQAYALVLWTLRVDENSDKFLAGDLTD